MNNTYPFYWGWGWSSIYRTLKIVMKARNPDEMKVRKRADSKVTFRVGPKVTREWLKSDQKGLKVTQKWLKCDILSHFESLFCHLGPTWKVTFESLFRYFRNLEKGAFAKGALRKFALNSAHICANCRYFMSCIRWRLRKIVANSKFVANLKVNFRQFHVNTFGGHEQ